MDSDRNIPVLVAMKGHPGTGKTTLARAIAAILHCPLLAKDDIRSCTHPIQPSILNDLSYSVLFRITETQLRLGLTVVADSPLSRQAHLDTLTSIAGHTGARVVVVECCPGDKEEWRRRLEARGRGGDNWPKPATWQELEMLLEGYQGCYEYDVGDVEKLVVDTTAVATDDLAAKVVEFVKCSGRGGTSSM